MLIVSTIPAVIFALLLKDVIDTFAKLWFVGTLLIVNGLMLLQGSRKKELDIIVPDWFSSLDFTGFQDLVYRLAKLKETAHSYCSFPL